MYNHNDHIMLLTFLEMVITILQLSIYWIIDESANNVFS